MHEPTDFITLNAHTSQPTRLDVSDLRTALLSGQEARLSGLYIDTLGSNRLIAEYTSTSGKTSVCLTDIIECL